jgi:hypothetical protein
MPRSATDHKQPVSGHWDLNPEPCADLALTPLIRRLLYQLSYAPEVKTRLVPGGLRLNGRGGRS